MIGQKIQSSGLKGSRENFAQREKHGIPNRWEEGPREEDEAKSLLVKCSLANQRSHMRYHQHSIKDGIFFFGHLLPVWRFFPFSRPELCLCSCFTASKLLLPHPFLSLSYRVSKPHGFLSAATIRFCWLKIIQIKELLEAENNSKNLHSSCWETSSSELFLTAT